MIRKILLLILTCIFTSVVYAESDPESVLIPLEYSKGESSLAWDFFFPSEDLSAIEFHIDTEGPKPYLSINYIDEKKEFYYTFCADTIEYNYISDLASLLLYGSSDNSIEISYYDKLLIFYFNEDSYELYITAGGNEFFEKESASYKKPKSSGRLQLSDTTIEKTFMKLNDLIQGARAKGIVAIKGEDEDDEYYDW